MVNTILYIISIILLIMDSAFLCICIWFFINEIIYKKRICRNNGQYNKKINTFQWYYDGYGEIKGVKELANIYDKLQHLFAGIEPIYKKFLKKFFKVAVKSNDYQENIEKINKFMGIDNEIAKKGIFLKIRQKRQLKKTKYFMSDSKIYNGEKNTVFNIQGFYLLQTIIQGLLLIAVLFIITYIIQFIYIDGLYMGEVKKIFLKLFLYIACIIPAIIILLFSIYERTFDLFILLLWGMWTIVSSICSFLIIIVVYSIKDLSYTILLVKRVIHPKLYIAAFLLYLFVKLLATYCKRLDNLKEMLEISERDLKDILQEEYESRLKDDLEMLNEYVSLLELQLVTKDTNTGNKCINDMTVQEKLLCICERPEYQASTRKIKEDKKNEIISVLCDYKCLEAVLSRPFAINGKVNVKGMRDARDRFYDTFS